MFKEVGDWFEEKFGDAWDAIEEAFKEAVDFFSDIWKDIQKIYKSVGEWFGDRFEDAFKNIKKAFNGITKYFQDIFDTIKNIFSKIGETIGGGITKTVSYAINGIMKTAVGIINGFIDGINGVIGIINAIPGVELGKIGKLSVPQMAEGGVVDGATLAMVGEAGAEMIMPLENNLGYLDKLAGMLNERMGGNSNQPIVLQVDGKTFAQISVDSINQLTKQTGSLPLVIA